jgi:hypothetical protein
MMVIEEMCGGWAVYWPGRPGERLQGWYRDAGRALLAVEQGNEWLIAQAEKKLR